MKAAKAPKQTERSMIRLLHKRYNTSSGNGPRYAGMAHVRNDAGFEANRTADYIAIDLWPSKGLMLHGHEVKISRSDWLNELKDPEKSGAFMKHVDYWWLVIADAAMVRPGELPQGWGMMAVGSDGNLRVVKQAPRLNKVDLPPEANALGILRPQYPAVHRGLVAAMLRSAAKSAMVETTRELTEAHEGWIATHNKGATLYEVWATSHLAYGEYGPTRWRIKTLGNEEEAQDLARQLSRDYYDEHGTPYGRRYHAERVEYFVYGRRTWV